jgi:tripartite-type tricarboxylate transporter receptor subunit TctC
MQLRRRQFLHLAAGATAATAMPGRSRADTYPSRPVRIIVGFSAGSASDIIARLTAQYLSEKLGHQFVVENHPGAATNLAAEYVVRAAPDGYTLLLLTSANTVNATLYTKLNFNLRTDITPIASIDLVPYVMEVTNAFPAKTVAEFIAYAKANPGKINMASNGIGSGPHVAGELFQMMAGVKLVHVAYTGNPYADLIAGQVQMMFSPIPASIAYVRSKQLRPLAVGTPTRLQIMPDLPTVAETLPSYDASGWHALAAPKGVSADVVALIGKAVAAGLDDPAFKKKLIDLGSLPMPMTSAEFGKYVVDDIAKWAKVIKFADIKAD